MENRLSKLSVIIYIILTIAEIVGAVAMFQYGIIGIIATTGVMIVEIIGYLYIKDIIEERSDQICLHFCKVGFALYILSFMALPLGFIKNTGRNMPGVILFVFIATGVIVAAAIVKSEKINQGWEKIREARGLNKSGLQLTKAEDIKICVNKETKQDVYIQAKDRFVHMLILGPTGSGKTSQIILPMISQDIKNSRCGITVLEPKSDLAEQVYAMAKIHGRACFYFNPVSADCPRFNPLYGDTSEVIENMVITFSMLDPDSSTYFKGQNEQLLRNGLKVIKKLYGNEASFIHLSSLIQNSGGAGIEMINAFQKLYSKTPDEAKENLDIASWFRTSYFAPKSKEYEGTSGLRQQVMKIIANPHLRRVLNPTGGESDIDFAKHIAENTVMAITTCQGELRELSRYLGYFIILQFQSAVFRRPGREKTRSPHFLYIDEFQSYSNPGFSDMLTQGRSYRVASHLATQNRDLIAMGSGREGEEFLTLVSTNARNIILFPDMNIKDAKYYSEELGEIKEIKVDKGYSKSKFNPLYGFQTMRYPTETVRESEQSVPRFTTTNLKYDIKFGEVVYSILRNNSREIPAVGQIKFLPEDYIETITRIVDNYNEKNKVSLTKEYEAAEIYETSDIRYIDDDPDGEDESTRQSSEVPSVVDSAEPIIPETLKAFVAKDGQEDNETEEVDIMNLAEEFEKDTLI